MARASSSRPLPVANGFRSGGQHLEELARHRRAAIAGVAAQEDVRRHRGRRVEQRHRPRAGRPAPSRATDRPSASAPVAVALRPVDLAAELANAAFAGSFKSALCLFEVGVHLALPLAQLRLERVGGAVGSGGPIIGSSFGSFELAKTP